MCQIINISVFLSIVGAIKSAYLEAESNYLKPKLERNNILNKGLWVRKISEPKTSGDFIFKANSYDVENVLQNNNDAFGENDMQNIPFFSTYIERSKRSAVHKPKQRLRKSLSNCKDKGRCLQTNDDKMATKSKFLSTLKPASVFNDYPYEVAVLLGNDDRNKVANTIANDSIKIKANNGVKGIVDDTSPMFFTNDVQNYNDSLRLIKKLENKENHTSFLVLSNSTSNRSLSIPKRSMPQRNYESEVLKKLELTKELTPKDNVNGKLDRNVFEKDNVAWHQTAPVRNFDKYTVLPKIQEKPKNKPISEKGLLKVLSMLTKTFKKIIKQHNDIKNIHSRLHNLNNDFMQNLEILTKKFENFDTKYTYIMKINDKINEIETNLKNKEEFYINREKEMSKNLFEFENQQKKFLAQQRQFYNIQKLMLAQNEKINSKQNDIVKTQNEISLRQNYFAKLLKKTKQTYHINKISSNSDKLHKEIPKPTAPTTEKEDGKISVLTTTLGPKTTESIKINLFSIPTTKVLQNQDENLLSEKDDQPVDDLIYKYYFNNTFINDAIKEKILASFMATSENTNKVNNKNKRNHLLETTVLLPVSNRDATTTLHRQRRWIRHINRKNNKKEQKNIVNSKAKIINTPDKNNHETDPFFKMATNFCNEIGQNKNDQMFKWCIEKALRRLQVIDLNIAPSGVLPGDKIESKGQNTKIAANVTTPTLLTVNTVTTAIPIEKVTKTVLPSDVTSMFFPDNDELEVNLKQYELKPDTEGTVYYDGSVHTSQIENLDEHDSEAFSDIMPGLDSNSRIEVEPLAIDLQAQRRATVRRINERMRMRLG